MSGRSEDGREREAEPHNRFWPTEPVPCQAVGEVCYVSKHPLARQQPCQACPQKPE